jgi:hypothetical protein
MQNKQYQDGSLDQYKQTIYLKKLEKQKQSIPKISEEKK